MNVFELVGTFAIEGVDRAARQIGSATDGAKADFARMAKGAKGSAGDVGRGMADAGGSVKGMSDRAQGAAARFGSAMDKIGRGAKRAGALAAKGMGAVAGAAAGAVAGLTALAAGSQEYVEGTTRLVNAADAVGVSQKKANEVYQGFLGLTGDSDQATEAAQDMLNLAQAGGDIDAWYNIAAGTMARFGDALPVENLIESANETVRTGKVVGSMADAVNWASASSEQWARALGGHPAALRAFERATAEGESAEDAFNAALAACSGQAERTAITQAALNEIYGETGECFREGMADVAAARIAQDEYNAAVAGAGRAMLPLQAGVLGLAAGLVGRLVPGLEQAGAGLAGMLEGREGAADQFSQGATEAIGQLVQGVTGALPMLLQVGATVLGALAQGIVQAVPGLAQGLAGVLPQLVATVAGLLTQLLGQATAMLPTLLPLVVQALAGMAVALADALPAWNQAIADAVTQLAAMLPTLLPQLLEAAVQLLMALVQAVPQIVPPLVGAIPVVVQAVCSALPALVPMLVQAAIALFMGLVDCLPAVTDALVAAIPAVIDAVVAMLPALVPVLLEAAVRLFMALVQAVPKVAGPLLGAVGSLLGQIPGKIAGFAGRLATAAGDMIAGMVRGIQGAAGRVWEAITGVCSNALGAVKSFFGIKSPSRLMRKMFGYVGEGMALGLEDSERGVLGAMRSVVEGAARVAREWEAPSLGVASAIDARASLAAASPALAGASPGGAGDTYNMYLNDLKVNEDEQIQAVVIDAVNVLRRKGRM